MPFTKPPSHGLIGLLTGHDPFEIHVEAAAIHGLVRIGLFPIFDLPRLKKTRDIWRECILRWRDEGEDDSKVSHIKMAGALLWSFIQKEARPVEDVVKLSRQHHSRLEQFGASDRVREFRHGVGEIFQASPNPAVGYMVVLSIFNTIQRARGITRLGIDFDEPPLTKHYFQNLACWYMRKCDPSPEDLYMIFKTMDLYALDHGETRPAS